MDNKKIIVYFFSIIFLLVSFLLVNYDLNLYEGYKAAKMQFNYEKHFIARYSTKRSVRSEGLYSLYEWKNDEGRITQVDYLNKLLKIRMKTVYYWLDGYKNISYFRFGRLVKTERYYPEGNPEMIQDYIKMEQKIYFKDGGLSMESGLKWVKGRPVLEQYLPDAYVNYYYPGIQGEPIIKETKVFGPDGSVQTVVYHLDGKKKEIGMEKAPAGEGNGRFFRTGKWQFFDEDGLFWKELTYDGEMILDEKIYKNGKYISKRILNHRQ